MMDGLEAVEVRLSEVQKNKDIRWDSPFWTTLIVKNPTLQYEKIGDILKKSQYGISISMNEDKIGLPIYRMNEIHNMLCDIQVDKYADITQPEIATFTLEDKDVLFNRTNSFEWVGRTGVYYKNSSLPYIFASYLVRFVPDEKKVSPEFLAAFLSCKYGIKAVKARARQSINQTNVNPEEVKEIEIPLLCKRLQDTIVKCFKKANKNILLSDTIYSSAESLLLSHLGLENYAHNTSGIAIKSLGESFGASGRLDSEYYLPKYEEIEEKLQSIKTIQDTCTLHDTNFVPNGKEEYTYIELSSIGESGEIKDVEKIMGVDLPTRARRKIQKGQVVISSIEGSLESCALVYNDYDNLLCSTGFYVLSSKIYNTETLLVLFKSSPIQTLMKKHCSGTILTAINKEAFLSIPLPNIPIEKQTQVAEKVQQSFALRKEAHALLDKAKQAVEIAIEQDENAAMKELER